MSIVTRDIMKIMELILSNCEIYVWLKLRINSNLFLLKRTTSSNCLKMLVPQFFFRNTRSLFHDERSMCENKFCVKVVLQNNSFSVWKVLLRILTYLNTTELAFWLSVLRTGSQFKTSAILGTHGLSYLSFDKGKYICVE